MRKSSISILTIIIISSILRLWNIGSVPVGLSLLEIKSGLSFSSLTPLFFEPSFLRLPFALIGILSIFLFYLLLKKYFDKNYIPVIGSALFSVMPWHIQESRVFSAGMFLLVLIQSAILLLPRNVLTSTKFQSVVFKVATFSLVATFLIPFRNVTSSVNEQRLLVSGSSPVLISKIFINKVTENLEFREKQLFENIDIGTFFFSGHPRERWGVEERAKMYIFIIPLLVFGLVKASNGVLKMTIAYIIICIAFLSVFDFNHTLSLILILPFAILSPLAFLPSKKYMLNKLMIVGLFIFGFYELLNFLFIYSSNKNISMFSGRRSVYPDLIYKVQSLKGDGGTVLVNDKIGDVNYYFKYYLKNKIEGYEFRSFNIWKETHNNERLYVDVIPKDAGPSEPLYTTGGSFPNQLDILAKFEDFEKRTTIVVYKTKDFKNNDF